MKSATQIAVCFLLLLAASAWANPAAVDGTWLSGDGDGLVAVRVIGSEISATLLGSPNKDRGRAKTDIKNPDPALRERALVGLEIFSGFRYDGDGEWGGGQIYDPNSGKTYSCKLRLLDQNTLKVRGYIGISLIGRTEIWRRQPD
jgi:uncharacterized protein (DUF2147 family)